MFLFKKPEYYLCLPNIVRRLRNSNTMGILHTKTIFGKNIEIDASDAIGKSILHTGIYDLALSEILWVLAEKGNTCVDIGANIGYTSMLMAEKVGTTGTVTSFEPNPNLLPRLKANLAPYITTGNIVLNEFALSDHNGEAYLNIPDESMHNDGTATVALSANPKSLPIQLKTLDESINLHTHIDLLKIDVEGHELNVFKGAIQLLIARRIKHIVFEENESYPSDVSNFLNQYGYTILRIQKGWFGVELKDPISPKPIDAQYEAANYLATLDLNQVQQKLKNVVGYSILQ